MWDSIELRFGPFYWHVLNTVVGQLLCQRFISPTERKEGIMARTSLNVFQSGLGSCISCAYFNLLWQQDKVFKRKENWLAKQGHKFNLSFYL